MNKLNEGHLEASVIVAQQIMEETSVEMLIYLEGMGVSIEQYYEIIIKECDVILADSVRTIKPANVYIRDFTERWNNYLMENEFGYFLVSAMRGLNIIEDGPEIRLAPWMIDLAFLFEEHPVHSLNISRGQGKSWILLLYYEFLAFRYKKKKGAKFTKYSMGENLMIFAGDDLAKQHIKQITAWTEGNYVLWKRLAQGNGYQPSATLMRFGNGAQMIAKTFMSSARGFRGTLLIDDYNLEEFNMNTMVQDKMFDRITKALFPIASNPFSQIVMAATPISPTDLIQRIWKDGGSKIMKWEYRAIESDGTILDYNLQPLQRIMERRETYSKRAFLQEIMLIADVDVDRMFTWEILEKCKDTSYSYSDTFKDFYYSARTEQVYMGADYSFSTSDESDYNAFATIAWTKDIFDVGKLRLFNLFLKQVMSLPEQVRVAKELYHRLEVDVLYSESNGMQTSISDQLITMGLNVQKMNTTAKFKLSPTHGIPVIAHIMDIGYFKLPYATEADRELTDRILQQFYSMIVIEKRGSPTKLEAAAGNNDDIVLAISQAVLGCKIIEQIRLLNGSEADEWNKMIDRERQKEQELDGYWGN